MDDPLKPKTVPLAAETILWFEFLLDPELITKHLQKPNPDPSALDLLLQFISMTPDNIVTPQPFTISMPPSLPPSLPPPPPTNTNSVIPAVIPPVSNTDNMIPVGIVLPIITNPPPVTTSAVTGITATNNIADGLRLSQKQLALKILALKLGTYLKWNLDMLEKQLPISKQLFLLRDLCTISFGKKVCIPLPVDFDPTITIDGNERAARFALTFYHRWVLRLQILKDIAVKAARPSLSNIFVPLEPMHQFFAPDIPPQSSIDYLKELCTSFEPFYVFTYDTFMPLHPSEDDNLYPCNRAQKFERMLKISLSELRAQICYDLVNFYLYTKQYNLAQDAARECRDNLFRTRQEYASQGKDSKHFVFCQINETELEGYLLACGVGIKQPSLVERFNSAALNQYKDIFEILKLDNKAREIPFVNRRLMELDIQGAISQGILSESRLFEMKVAALNIVRSIFEEGTLFTSVDYFEKYFFLNSFTALLEYIVDLYFSSNESDRKKLKQFLINVILEKREKSWLQAIKDTQILSIGELRELEKDIQDEEIPVPSVNFFNEWKSNSKSDVEIGMLEQQLIVCTNANMIRKILVKLASTNPAKPLWTVNPSWEIATPIKTVLMSLQGGFLQDFAYVLLGKSRELSARKDYSGAVALLNVLKSETLRPDISAQTIIVKIGKLVSWEILFIQIKQCLDEWHQNTQDLTSLGSRCRQCLSSLQNNEIVIPRMEILECCSMMLLNLNEWSAVANLDRRLTHLELAIAFATTFIDMEKMKGAKKICRDAWDLVLSTFYYNSKRSNVVSSNSGNQGNNVSNNGSPGNGNNGTSSGIAGVSGNIPIDNNNLTSGNGNNNANMSNAGAGNSTINGSSSNPTTSSTISGISSVAGGNNNTKYVNSSSTTTNLQTFIKFIRHQTLFNLTISILAKIHNLLKDDVNYDINGEYMHLWPTSLSNPLSSYNIRSVGETLHWLLTEALKYYPQTIAWLKIKGDLELAMGNNEAAMRYYVNALITGTDYCTIPLQRNIADDYVIRKMIRCSSNLGCHMQATVLCQFLEEIDYGIVFKNLPEKSSNFTDAMDAFYNCIWDTTLLEFIINLHAKKGEHSRKLEAISIMGALELNANNNDEIKREAAAIRKSRFLRALAKQYLL